LVVLDVSFCEVNYVVGSDSGTNRNFRIGNKSGIIVLSSCQSNKIQSVVLAKTLLGNTMDHVVHKGSWRTSLTRVPVVKLIHFELRFEKADELGLFGTGREDILGTEREVWDGVTRLLEYVKSL
jgi:methyl coenzyme M reductase subunit C